MFANPSSQMAVFLGQHILNLPWIREKALNPFADKNSVCIPVDRFALTWQQLMDTAGGLLSRQLVFCISNGQRVVKLSNIFRSGLEERSLTAALLTFVDRMVQDRVTTAFSATRDLVWRSYLGIGNPAEVRVLESEVLSLATEAKAAVIALLPRKKDGDDGKAYLTFPVSYGAQRQTEDYTGIYRFAELIQGRLREDALSVVRTLGESDCLITERGFEIKGLMPVQTCQLSADGYLRFCFNPVADGSMVLNLKQDRSGLLAGLVDILVNRHSAQLFDKLETLVDAAERCETYQVAGCVNALMEFERQFSSVGGTSILTAAPDALKRRIFAVSLKHMIVDADWLNKVRPAEISEDIVKAYPGAMAFYAASMNDAGLLDKALASTSNYPAPISIDEMQHSLFYLALIGIGRGNDFLGTMRVLAKPEYARFAFDQERRASRQWGVLGLLGNNLYEREDQVDHQPYIEALNIILSTDGFYQTKDAIPELLSLIRMPFPVEHLVRPLTERQFTIPAAKQIFVALGIAGYDKAALATTLMNQYFNGNPPEGLTAEESFYLGIGLHNVDLLRQGMSAHTVSRDDIKHAIFQAKYRWNRIKEDPAEAEKFKRSGSDVLIALCQGVMFSLADRSDHGYSLLDYIGTTPLRFS